jgi:hypothetical protein
LSIGYSLGSSKESFTGNYGYKGCYGYQPTKTVFYGTINGGIVSSPSQVKPIASKDSTKYFRLSGWGETCDQTSKLPSG